MTDRNLEFVPEPKKKKKTNIQVVSLEFHCDGDVSVLVGEYYIARICCDTGELTTYADVGEETGLSLGSNDSITVDETLNPETRDMLERNPQ